MFLTEEKLIKKISQDRNRGDFEKARRNAQMGYNKWPDNFDISMELIQLCLELSDYREAVKLLKSTVIRNPGKKAEILQYSRETFYQTNDPLLGSFILEALIRSKDIDRTSDFLGRVSKDYIADLITRSRTKSRGFKDADNTNNPKFTDNELLLGLLYIEKKQYEDALSPMLNVLKNSPENAKVIGETILNIRRELPYSALLEYTLGLASMLLNHPDKAEQRFFKSMEFENPPLEDILSIIRNSGEKSENHLLLLGETLFRLGKENEGSDSVKQYLIEDKDWQRETDENKVNQLFPAHIDKKNLVVDRLKILLEENLNIPSAAFLLCDVLSDLSNYRDAISELEKLSSAAAGNTAEIISWIMKKGDLLQTAPAQRLLAILNTNIEDYEEAQKSYETASEMDPTLIPELLQHVENHIEQNGENKTLLKILTALYSKCNNSERAEELLQRLKDEHSLDNIEALKMTSEVIKNCGPTLSSVLSVIKISITNNDIAGGLPHAIEFYRENPGKHSEFAAELRTIAGDDSHNWSFLSRLLDGMKEKTDLSKPFQLLHAHSNLNSGNIEKAVFAYDQLMMFDEDIKLDVISEYEKVVGDNLDNTTLLLALYQLHFDEEQLVLASHFLGKALESDPSQIKDIIAGFNKIVDAEPSNKDIWGEFLNSTLAINHTSLAQEILSRAVSTLGGEEAAALHIYGAKISRENNKIEDSLKCLAMTLTSKNPDLKSVEKELDEITSIEPANPEALYLKSETYLRLGEEEKAASSFKECAELSPKYHNRILERLKTVLPVSVKPWLINKLLGSIAWKQNRPEEALALLSKAQKGPEESIKALGLELEQHLAESPDNYQLRKLYAENLRLENKYSEAVREIEYLLSGNSDFTDESITFLTGITEEEPLHFNANKLLAEILIKRGKSDESLTPAVNMLLSKADPTQIEKCADIFYEIHNTNNRFLIGYANIKALVNKMDSSLDFYRSALQKDPGDSGEILEGLREHKWPRDLLVSSEMLTADCHIAAGEYEWAFKSLKNLAEMENTDPPGIISRINSLIDNQPKTEYFSLAVNLYTVNHNFDKAEEIIKKGGHALSAGDIIELKIELAGLIDRKGFKNRASRLYYEILNDVEDKQSILKRIEESLGWTADKKILEGIAQAKNGLIDDEKAVDLVDTALDYGRLEAAFQIAEGLPATTRSFLLGKIYIASERPFLASTILSSVSDAPSLPEGMRVEILYALGSASETLRDYGRAASSFMKILEIQGEYLDTRRRAETNYTKFINSEIVNEKMILEKTGSL